MKIMTNKLPQSNRLESDGLQSSLKDYLQQAARNATPIHEVEKHIFTTVLAMGQRALGYFFELQGDGDRGESLTLGTQHEVKRLNKGTRHYQSIFGSFTLTRYRYGTREGQKLECIPFDERLALPESDYGFLLQEWSQLIAVEVPFKTTARLLEKIFPIKVPVDSLEQLNHAQAEQVTAFGADKKIKPEEEEALIVVSADGKGVPIKHKKDQARIEEHKRKRGPKPGRKRMAVVGAVYSVAQHVRTPEQIIEALFIEPGQTEGATVPSRPAPQNKQVVANLTREVNGQWVNATTTTFFWIKEQVKERDAPRKKPCVALMDGQTSLWEALHHQFSESPPVEILDILHVTSRLWDAANIFYLNDKTIQTEFMKKRVLRVLKGEAKSVISGFRQMATKQSMTKKKLNKLEVVCHYLENNLPRMRYDDYLSKGYPIASGVIEGACRHFVKDRMERAGMHWSIEGAQAMLHLRSIYLNADWDEFTAYRIKKEIERLHKNRDVFEKADWPLAA